MRLPIQYALVYPERVNTDLPRMPLSAYANLTFEAPDETKFPALGLARYAVNRGGTMPAVMNAAQRSRRRLISGLQNPVSGNRAPRGTNDGAAQPDAADAGKYSGSR